MARLAKGSANEVLAMNSGASAPEWQSPTTGDITGVTAGDGLTGGGTSGGVTLAVGAGTGIDVSADAIAVDVSDFMANGSDNRVVTATGADHESAREQGDHGRCLHDVMHGWDPLWEELRDSCRESVVLESV